MNYDEIAQDDNFFLLGGDSILGIIMLARLLEETDAELTMLDLYERPKPSQLGELLERRLAQP